MKLNDYEVRHNEYLRRNGAECTVLLRRDGHFPLKAPGKLALYGSGARHTVKGGTGSGEVNSRFFVTVEQGLRDAGFQITSGRWLDAYDKLRKKARAQFVKDVKAEAKAAHVNVVMYGMGRSMPEPEHDLPLTAEGDTAVYVLSRISGEGSDRSLNDVRLSPGEVRDIVTCSEKYKNFILVINAGGVVDLSPVRDVKNILVLSQLGVETGNILADLLLGVSAPSGKLTTTWAPRSKTPGDFGQRDDTRYREGIYVGYRWFDTAGEKPLYPFGFGLGWSDFQISDEKVSLDGSKVTVSANIANTGAHTGKETLQVYVSAPQGRLDQPYQALAAFTKTNELRPGDSETVTASFDMADIASYDTANAAWILEPGSYVVRAGASSAATVPAAVIRVEGQRTVRRVRTLIPEPDFTDLRPEDPVLPPVPEDVPVLDLAPEAIKTIDTAYDPEYVTDPAVNELSDGDLMDMCLGAYDKNAGLASIIGNASFTVAGAAGQSCMRFREKGIPSLVMADGPAGVRVAPRYTQNDRGARAVGGTMISSFSDFLPAPVNFVLSHMGGPKPGEEVLEHYATAIPIGTAIAQSFNTVFAENCGDMVGEEMDKFGVQLWLAPALNIHRNILCGRNFEYFSEDPLVSGKFAAALTRGVQRRPNCGTTIKHFAANNQELNRTQNSSMVSERALREIYLRGFGIAVRESQPRAVMTSYNLINGTHSSELRCLTEDVLRAEFGFEGIVMTDWVVRGFMESDCKYPVARADNVIMAGGDIFMPGCAEDHEDLRAGLAAGRLTRQQLEISASRVIRMARRLCK